MSLPFLKVPGLKYPQILLGRYNDKMRASGFHPGSGHSNLGILGGGQFTGDSLRTSTLQKNLENTHGYIGHPYLHSRVGLGAMWRVEQTSPFSCPWAQPPWSLPLPACPCRGVFCGLPTRGPSVFHNEYSHQPTHMSPQYSSLCTEPASLTEPDIRWANKREGETICVAKEFLTLKSHMIPFKCHLPQSLLTDH